MSCVVEHEKEIHIDLLLFLVFSFWPLNSNFLPFHHWHLQQISFPKKGELFLSFVFFRFFTKSLNHRSINKSLWKASQVLQRLLQLTSLINQLQSINQLLSLTLWHRAYPIGLLGGWTSPAWHVAVSSRLWCPCLICACWNWHPSNASSHCTTLMKLVLPPQRSRWNF